MAALGCRPSGRTGDPVSASLQVRGDTWRIRLRYKRQQSTYPVMSVDETDVQVALTKAKHVRSRHKARLLGLPPRLGILTFIRHDGKPPAPMPDPEGRPETAFAES